MNKCKWISVITTDYHQNISFRVGPGNFEIWKLEGEKIQFLRGFCGTLPKEICISKVS